MKKVLGTTLDEGGANLKENKAAETLYQIIAVPAELTLWLKLTNYQNWTEPKLHPLFAQSN